MTWGLLSCKKRWEYLCLLLLWGFLFLLPMQVIAAGAISDGFQSSVSNIAPGTVLSLDPALGLAKPANISDTTDLLGIAGGKSLLELSNNRKDIQVVVSGLTQALVSNINGPINTGDQITASPLTGIGMKATNSTEVVGTAQASLTSVSTVTQKVTERNGKTDTVKVGLVPLDVNVSYYSAPQNASFLPPFLQSLANSVTGQRVSPLRVLVSSLTLLLGFLTVGVMLYSSIRSSITAIGRNPLAQSSLRKGLIDILVTAVGVLAIMLVAIYTILKT
jgi:hypothetical protein